jgi:hypothetical protein
MIIGEKYQLVKTDSETKTSPQPKEKSKTPVFTKCSGVKKSTSPGLVISTFGLAEIISCMPDGLVKKYNWILTNLSIFTYLLIFIYVICCLISAKEGKNMCVYDHITKKSRVGRH